MGNALQGMFRHFLELRTSVRSLVMLFWIYSLTSNLTAVFIQLFLYQEFTSVAFNVSATILYYAGIALSFCGLGYVMGHWKFDIKHGFAWSFGVMGGTFVLLLLTASPAVGYAAMLLNGIGTGLFWLTIHTYELAETTDSERDLYSSLLTAGTVAFSVLGPAFATLLLWVSGTVLHWGDFTLLFIITPIIYLLGFFCFSGLREYRPPRTDWSDVMHFFTEKRNRRAQLYLFGTGFHDIFSVILPPLVALFILGTTVKVGLYTTAFALFSALCVLVLAPYRSRGNRLLILGLSTCVFAYATLWFGYVFTFWALIVYSIVIGLAWPIMRVSIHVTDLETMESIGKPGRDFYPTMLMRDVMLWIWRSAGGIVFLLVYGFATSEKEFLILGLYLFAASIFLLFLGGFVLIRAMRGKDAE